jgi:hypothetical protein
MRFYPFDTESYRLYTSSRQYSLDTREFKQPLQIFVVAYFVLRVSCVSIVQTGSVQIQIPSEGLTLSSRPPLIFGFVLAYFFYSLNNLERIVKKLPF